MQLVVWNSQGAKWDTFWTYYASPLTATGDDVVGMLVESGWAPWVQNRAVRANAGYRYNSRASWFQDATATSAWCAAIGGTRGRYCFWIPWVGDPGAYRTNSRCSMAGLFLPTQYSGSLDGQCVYPEYRRPVVVFRLTRSRTTVLTILLVHLLSGGGPGTQAELNGLIANMTALIPEGTPGVVMGDINIDLIGHPVTVPDRWRLLRTGVATQQSGGELDWALLYDPNDHYAGAQATVLEQYKTGNNQSDHSVLRYFIPLDDPMT